MDYDTAMIFAETIADAIDRSHTNHKPTSQVKRIYGETLQADEGTAVVFAHVYEVSGEDVPLWLAGVYVYVVGFEADPDFSDPVRETSKRFSLYGNGRSEAVRYAIEAADVFKAQITGK